jgi:1,2-dihydroxy-3-keto-5-methylthiopentene dioxygenase
MSTLFVYRDDAPERPLEATRDGARIAQLLGALGVRFERWRADRVLDGGASQEEILAAYGAEVARLQQGCGYRAADVVRLERGAENAAAARAKFRREHRHAEDEVRFFVEGSGSFYLRPHDRVYLVVCERDDLIGVPANTRHWFDMGADPHFCAIRLFTNPDGWVADFTGDEIATRFPDHDAARAAGATAPRG